VKRLSRMRTALPLRLTSKLIASVWVIAFVSFVYGQTAKVPDWQRAAGEKLAFEVASIRQISPDPAWVGNHFEINAQDQFVPTGGLFRANARLIMYLIFAYKITDSSQYDSLVAQLPKWGNIDQFVIEARAQGDPTKDQYRLMMQTLLAERFKLKIHTENRGLPVYALVLDKPGRLGPALQPHPDNAPCALKPEKPVRLFPPIAVNCRDCLLSPEPCTGACSM
jgi:uncharacterized protein (TIGR03435 family)